MDINHVNKLAWTGLLKAIILSEGSPAYADIARMLIEASADVDLADGEGITPLQHAEQREYSSISAMLESAGDREV